MLFDLDGTLLDTAPDLAYALNEVRREERLPSLEFDAIRPVVSHGGRALIQLGFGLAEEDPEFERLRQRLLAIYRENLARHTRPFPGMEEVLRFIEERGMRWGVVTNKPAWLTEPLLEALALFQRAATIVSGDTLAQRKPHPAPLLHACRQAGSRPEECLYVGDAQRDIEAGRRAKMRTLAALFGYILEQDDPLSWQADGVIESPQALIQWLEGQQAA